MRRDPACGFCGRLIGGGQINRHERVCGMGLSSRFQIIAVEGYPINQRAQRVGVKPSTSYTVCDSHRIWEPVADYWPKEGIADYLCRERAERMCKRLNFEERQAEEAAA